MTLRLGWLAKAQQVLGAVNVFGLESLRRHPYEFCRILEVLLCQIDVAFLVATIDAAGFTTKAKCLAVRHP